MKTEFKGTVDSMLLEALLTVRDCLPALQENQAAWPFNSRLGVCGNVNGVLYSQLGKSPHEYSNGLKRVMSGWPGIRHYSDESPLYPVGGYPEYVEEQRLGAVWHNQRRVELLDWLIKVVTEEIETRLAP